ncbi:MAG TPA: SGNH hydrolase domain-containing protein, partial [Halioglobus sp.]
EGYLHELMQAVANPPVLKDGRDCNSGARPEQQFPLSETCVFEEFAGSPALVLVGDSHAQTLAASVKSLAHSNRLNFIQISQSGCPHIVGEYTSQLCKERSETLRSFLKELSNPTIIYSARILWFIEDDWMDYRTRGKDARDKIRDDEQEANRRSQRTSYVTSTLNSWLDDGYREVIVYPVPETDKPVFVSLLWNPVPIQMAEQMPELSTPYDDFKKHIASSYAALDQVDGPNVMRVYPEKLFCRKQSGKCFATESDRIYFYDKSHVTGLGSDLIVREVANRLKLKVPESFRK